MFGKLKRTLTKSKIVLVAAVAALALGVTGGAVIAHNVSETGFPGSIKNQSHHSTTFAARVAEILGLDESAVQNAFAAAYRQGVDASYQDRLGRKVENGEITQEQADTRYVWFQARPAGGFGAFEHERRSSRRAREGRHGFGGLHDGGLGDYGSRTTDFANRVAANLGIDESEVQAAFTQARRQGVDEDYLGRLDAMVSDSQITQEEADTRFAWFETRPNTAVGALAQIQMGKFGRGSRGDGIEAGESAYSVANFANRVAANLSLESGEVQAAFTEAKRQGVDEAYQRWLDLAAQDGRITQEEAGTRFAWFQGRPDNILDQNWRERPFFRRGHRAGGMDTDGAAYSADKFIGRVATILGLGESTVQEAFAGARRQAVDETYQGRLDGMVAAGRMTQEEADAQHSWFQARPDNVFNHDAQDRRSFRQGHDGKRGGSEHDGAGDADSGISPSQ